LPRVERAVPLALGSERDASVAAHVNVLIFPSTQKTRVYELTKGRHLLIDCRNVPREVCLDDRGMLEAMGRAAASAGATVISQVRYRFGHDSPPGFAAVVLLDESHVSAHSYADLNMVALDVFTCGATDPRHVFELLRTEVDLGETDVREVDRFPLPAMVGT
jgi:S-adenosylmethionine decarboxylase